VYSYDQNNPWTAKINEALIADFSQNGYAYESFYMNITPNSDVNFMTNAGGQAMEKYKA